MLGTNRKETKQAHESKRIPLKSSNVKNVESHILSYNCTKYEKFFHYYTACGILVETRGAIEVKKIRNNKNNQSTQLIYKHSKKPVYLALCDETSANVNGSQECDIDLLVDDNALRMSATVTSSNAAANGQSIDGDQLMAKRKKTIEQGDFNETAEELLNYLKRGASSREFNSAIDREKPHQFLANNLIDLVLFSEILAEHICVYLVPIPELRRTRVQFYWCVRETKTPFSPLVAKWMLQNYTDRHGSLVRVPNAHRRTTRTNNPDLALLGSLLATPLPTPAVPVEQIADDNPDFETNEEIQRNWGALRDNAADLTTLPGFVRPQVPLVSRESFYDTTTFSKTYGFMEVLRINQSHTDSTKLSQHARNTTSQEMYNSAFLDDTLVVDEDYQKYCDSHDLKNANSDVFRKHRTYANVSTDEIYTFTFFVEDLRRYCSTNNIADPQQCNRQNSNNVNKQMRFECLFDNTDMLMIDDSIQTALRTSGFVVLSMDKDFESASSSAPKLDEAYCFYLEKSCRCTETQLSLCTLLNYVARLEIEQIEPYAYEPPLFDEATEMQEAILKQGGPGPWIATDLEGDFNVRLYLTAQQASAFRWIREREDAVKAVKDRDVLRSIAIASTGWYYDCLTCRIYYDESCKRKMDEALQENHARIKRRKIDKNNSKNVDSSESFPFTVEAFNRNHAGKVDSVFIARHLHADRRIYQMDTNTYDTLFISGGPATGKRVTIIATVLHELTPFWQCQRTDEEWRGRKTTYKTRGNSKNTAIDARQAYFRQNWFERSDSVVDIAKNLALSRTSLYHFMRIAFTAALVRVEDESLSVEAGELYVDNTRVVATMVLDKIISRTHEDITVQSVFKEIWQSFMMVRAHHKLLSRNGPTHSEEVDAMAKLVEKEEMINEQEPQSLRHCNIVSRATLILCSEDELSRWLQAIDVFNQNDYELPNECWRFVAYDHQRAPIDAAVYVIKSIPDWQSFNLARLLLSDIVILTYECISEINIDDANYLLTFRNNVENIKTASFCCQRWMRCVKQHMSVVESTPCAGLVKSNEDIAAMSKKKRAKFQALEQMPIEAIRWQRVVVSNLEYANRNASLAVRGKRERYFGNLSQFFDNLRAVRRIYVDTQGHTPRTFIDTIFPTMKEAMVKSLVGDPMTPNSLMSHKQRWRHTLGLRMSPIEIAHLHPLVTLCYARKFQSFSVQSTHITKKNIVANIDCPQKSNPFVTKDVFCSIALDQKQEIILKNVLGMLRMVQDLQALYRASDSILYTNKINMPAFFTEISQWSTLDMFKGIVGFRSPLDMLIGDESKFRAELNSAISSCQASNVPTHIFSSKDGEFVRLVRMMDRFDPLAWRDFYFSRNASLQEPSPSVSHLKPTYRFILNAITHAPHLATAIFPILTELLVYRDARLLSTMTRSNTDTPEFPFTRNNGPEILSRSSLQMTVIEADRVRRIVPPPPPPPPPLEQPPPPLEQPPPPPSQVVADSPMLTPNDNSLLSRWFDQLRSRPATTVNFEFEFPSPLCLQLRSAGKNEANQQEMLNASELNDFRDFLFWRINTTLADECFLQTVFKDHTRPDFSTAIIWSEDFDGLRVPLNKVELLSSFASKHLNYRHAQVSMSDRCMFAICDAAVNASKPVLHAVLQKKPIFLPSNAAKIENSQRALNDPNFISASGLQLVGSDEEPELRTAPLEMQRLTRRSILNDPANLRRQFYTEFMNGLDRFYRCSTAKSLETFANETIFDNSSAESVTQTRNQENNFSLDLSDEDDDDDVSVSRNRPQPTLEMNNIIMFDEDGQVEGNDNVEQILEQLATNAVITLPRSLVPPSMRHSDEPKIIIDEAINMQIRDITGVIHRYIITEQNLLFERRCKDWFIVQLVRSLDEFVANFNSHLFFRKMPLLCRMDEQFGKLGAEKTEKQKAFSEIHRFHAQNDLLRGPGSTPLNFNSDQINTMAALHLRHHDQILQPLIEMLIYSGQVHGNMRQVPSNELRKLFEETGIGEKEQQELLVKIVGGVRTSAPTYLINMISKFCHETKWIQRDLDFIRQQRERTLGALPSLATLKNLLSEYRKTAQSDAFECPLCMESLCEAESVALFPCGHMCCYSCHTSCNSTTHRPRVDDVAIGVATVGQQCFLCRYLLQFNEKISKVTFSEAVSIILAKEPTTPAAPNAPVAESSRSLEEQPAQTPTTTNQRRIIGPLTAAEELREEFFDYESSDLDESVALTDDVEINLEPGEYDLGDLDIDDASSDSSIDKIFATAESKDPEFLKAGPVADRLIKLFEEFELSCDYSQRQIVVSYTMLQTMKNVMRIVVRKLQKENVCPNTFVKFVSLPLDYDDRLNVVSDTIYNAEYAAKIPVVIYMFHMDLNFHMTREQCLQPLLYINKISAVLMIETPSIRLVDDRASHLLAASIEQRFLSFFCNEFSITRPTVYRFVLTSENMQTVDQSWHDATRWYKNEN